jgi:O-antigen/teichoic acid export membrane protein
MGIRRVWEKLKAANPLGGGIALTALTNVVIALAGLMTSIIAARLLGPLGRGELRAIQTWPNFIAMIAVLGLPDALVYFTARDSKKVGRYLGSSVVLAMLLVIPFAVIGYCLLPVLLSAQSEEVVHIARWYLLLIPLLALISIPTYCLRGLERFASWNVVRLLPNVGWLVVLLAAVGLSKKSLWFLTTGHLSVMALLVIPILYTVIRLHGTGFRLDPGTWRPLTRFGLPSMLSSVPAILNLRVDQMAMAAWIHPRFLGFYVVAVAWSGAAYPLLTAVGSVLFPRVASETSDKEQGRLLAQGSRLGVLLSVVLTPLLIAATPWGLPLVFGAEFRGSVRPALVLVVAAVIAGLNRILEEGLKGRGQPSAVLKAESVGLAVTGVGLALLLVRYDVMGAALASLAGYMTIFILLIFQARRLTGLSAPSLLVPTGDEVRLVRSRLTGWSSILGRERRDKSPHTSGD